jgi:four helix bundle protein
MSRLLVLQHAIATAASISGAKLVHPVLARQLERSSSSVALNLAEGGGRFGKDRLQHYRIAYGSCQEAKATIAILVRGGHIDRETGVHWYRDLNRIGGMLWGLMRSCG